MNIQIVDEHSVDLDLLPESANILDAGCFGYGFCDYFKSKGHFVLAIDIKYDIDALAQQKYYPCGLSTFNGKATIQKDEDPQAWKIINKIEGEDVDVDFLNGEIALFSLSHIEKKLLQDKFHLVKLDIEGEELPVLLEATHPIAQQVSVEFHAHCGQTKEQLDELLDWLGQWYDIHNQVWEERHGAGFNYWDFLMIAK